MTPARLLAALPAHAAEALTAARRFYPSIDAADAWIAAASHPDREATGLADFLTAQARRMAGGALQTLRAGGEGVPFDQADPGMGGADPLQILLACEAAAEAMGAAGVALAEPEPSPTCTADLAARLGCTQRRVQQVLADRRELEALGQAELFV